MTRLTIILIACLGLIAPLAAAAQNYHFLKDTTVAEFTEQDFELLNGALAKLNSEAKKDMTEAWDNPKTGHKGSMKLVDILEEKGMPCHKILFHNDAGDRKGNSEFTYCRTASGEWKILK